MKLSFDIIHYRDGKRGNLYSVQFEGQPQCELDRFFLDFNSNGDFNRLFTRLNDLLTRFSFQEDYFRQESGLYNSVLALPHDKSKLRLYCCRWTTSILIAGYGGIKHTRTYQEDPLLYAAVKSMEYVDRRLRQALKEREFKISDDGKWFISSYGLKPLKIIHFDGEE